MARLTTRLDTLTRRLPPPRPVSPWQGNVGASGEAVLAKLCAHMERHAPPPKGATYPYGFARLDATLDRLHAAGVGVAAGAGVSRAERLAAAYGMTVSAFRDALRERAGG